MIIVQEELYVQVVQVQVEYIAPKYWQTNVSEPITNMTVLNGKIDDHSPLNSFQGSNFSKFFP